MIKITYWSLFIGQNNDLENKLITRYDRRDIK